MTVRIVRFNTGEEVIADITETDATITISNGAGVQFGMDPGGTQMKVGLVPWSPFVKGPVTVSKQNVMFVAEAIDDLYNRYNQMFGSGIQLARSL